MLVKTLSALFLYYNADAISIASSYDDATASFGQCISRYIELDGVTSFDGGKSAMRLMKICSTEFLTLHDECVKRGISGGQCDLIAAMLAQAAIKGAGR